MALVAKDLVGESPEGAYLIGARHRETGKIVFPFSQSLGDAYEPFALARNGVLWSYTIQRFPPGAPPYIGDADRESFRPFAIGYVELPGQVIVESRLDVEDFDDLKIGTPLEFTTIAFARGPDGKPVETFAFRPARGTAP